MIDETLDIKHRALEHRISQLGSLVVAYSGGVDSALLAYVTQKTIGGRCLAVLADSPSLSRNEYDAAVAFALEHSINLRVIKTDELDNPEYKRNGADRCFYCKQELFAVLEQIRVQQGYTAVAYGKNTDDANDIRPGARAAGLYEVVAPLAESGLNKEDVRELARLAGLHLWDKPASACLASRIEYGRPVTREALKAVEQAEAGLHRLGFSQCRVRHHGEIARIEIAQNEMSRVFEHGMVSQIVLTIKQAGFHFVALDLEGYRSGSMNTLLPPEALLIKKDQSTKPEFL